MTTLSLEEARSAVAAALRAAGANEAMAAAAARALVLAEAQGLGSHGLSRVAQYATHLRNSRVNGNAMPTLRRQKGAAALIDAHEGLAFAACEMAVAEAIGRARDFGIAIAGVTDSHHCGVVVDHLRPVAEAGMVGLGFANSPAAMPAAGGRHPIFGTNPVAAIFPRRGALPLAIDLSLSEAARGKVMVAAKQGKAIPIGWAVDRHGQPTTDAQAALEGSMLPIGAATSPKGAMLALVVELLVTALIGAQFGFEASSFFEDAGNRPRIGQAFIVIDPGALAGSAGYLDRVEVLVAEMLRDDGVRLPGARREELRLRAETQGIEVPEALLAQWRS
ncbi:Ldh family oxidoreductase [Variovorax paradoxus]|jgi:(2R)-3-sulfolactate dehydrogenase (NADP+)|uniref:Ldh family oxidoreductase n=1 Tax=Variovorax paradoxus TaxID=34073 RepID=UPI0029C819DE|nr:Ldh family oxidoreductase [Variovorax paradoxus]WPH19251.1 Ldh family oxidoreductase [Variovorax paradoxus]